MEERSALKTLMWLRRFVSKGAKYIWKNVSGLAPLSLPSALPSTLRKLTQYGYVETVNWDLYCNNGKLVAVDDELPAGYKRITGIKFDGDFWYDTGLKMRGSDEVTITLANTVTTGQNVFGSYNGTSSGTKNYSLFIYGGGSSSNSYLRYGEQLGRPKFGSNEHTLVINGNGTDGFTTDVTLTPDTFETAATAYIGMLPNSSSPAYTGSIIGSITISNRAKYVPCVRLSDSKVGYYELVNGVFLEPIGTGTPTAGNDDTSHLTVLAVEGTPEVLTISGTDHAQTASVVNLFGNGATYDEQNIITGIVTRRVKVEAVNGVINMSALEEPYTEQVTPQPLRTVEGTNTVSVVSNVDSVDLEVKYKKRLE